MKTYLLPALLLIAMGQTLPVNAQNPKIPTTQPDQLYFKIKPVFETAALDLKIINSRPALSALRGLFKKYEVKEIHRPFRSLPQVYQVSFNKQKGIEAFRRELAGLPYVEYAEKIPLPRVFTTVSDPLQNSQYHLGLIQAYDAFGLHKGSANAVVAIVDMECRYTHEDLYDNLWTNPGEIPGNTQDDDGNGYVDDVHGYDVADGDPNPYPNLNMYYGNLVFNHGTQCAGVAAAVTNNGKGIASVGFGVKFMPVKAKKDEDVLDPTVPFGYAGVEYAMYAGADVISLSWGDYTYSATNQSLMDNVFNAGILVVAAAGNDHVSTPAYPAAYNHVLAVASTGPSDVKSSFSNYGTWVDLCAPGENFTCVSSRYNTTYDINLSGTSMSCPLVAGLAALIKSYRPNWTPIALESCLKNGALNIDVLNPTYAGLLGSGRINAYQSMLCAAPCSGSDLISVDVLSVQPAQSDGISAGSPVSFSTTAVNATTFAWEVWSNGVLVNSTTTAGPNWTQVFTSAGAYTVCLQAGNGTASCDNRVCVDLRVCDEPAFLQAVAICQNTSATLYTGQATTGNESWYDISGAVLPIFTGNPFVTPLLNTPGIYSYWVDQQPKQGVFSVATPALSGTPVNVLDQGLYFTANQPFFLHSFDVQVLYSYGNSPLVMKIVNKNNLAESYTYTRWVGSGPSVQTYTVNQAFPPGEYYIRPEWRYYTNLSQIALPVFVQGGYAYPFEIAGQAGAFSVRGNIYYNSNTKIYSTPGTNMYTGIQNFRVTTLGNPCFAQRRQYDVHVLDNFSCSGALSYAENCVQVNYACVPTMSLGLSPCPTQNVKSFWRAIQIPPGTQWLDISVSGVPTAYVAIYESCGGPVKSCSSLGDGNHPPQTFSTLKVTQVIPGQTYYLQFMVDSAFNPTVTICLKPGKIQN